MRVNLAELIEASEKQGVTSLDFYRYIFINTKPLFGSVYFSRTQSTSELCMIGPKRFPNYLLTLRKQDDSNSCYSIGIVKQKQQIYLVDLIY